MLVAAAKINQSSIVPAFDQTRVPRIIQVPSGAANSCITPQVSVTHYNKRTYFLLQDFIATPLVPNVGLSLGL
jgi:hypothetical protein